MMASAFDAVTSDRPDRQFDNRVGVLLLICNTFIIIYGD